MYVFVGYLFYFEEVGYLLYENIARINKILFCPHSNIDRLYLIKTFIFAFVYILEKIESASCVGQDNGWLHCGWANFSGLEGDYDRKTKKFHYILLLVVRVLVG